MKGNYRVTGDAQRTATGGSGAAQGVVDSVVHGPVIHANDGDML